VKSGAVAWAFEVNTEPVATSMFHIPDSTAAAHSWHSKPALLLSFRDSRPKGVVLPTCSFFQASLQLASTPWRQCMAEAHRSTHPLQIRPTWQAAYQPFAPSACLAPLGFAHSDEANTASELNLTEVLVLECDPGAGAQSEAHACLKLRGSSCRFSLFRARLPLFTWCMLLAYKWQQQPEPS
jgi:hypothetical protein